MQIEAAAARPDDGRDIVEIARASGKDLQGARPPFLSVRLYMDVHVPRAITQGLRLRGIDVLTAQQHGARRLSDSELLDRSSSLRRVLFTRDADLRYGFRESPVSPMMLMISVANAERAVSGK